MSEARRTDSQDATEHAFAEELSPEARAETLKLQELYDVKVAISAELGTASMLVRDVLALRKGSVIQLNKVAGEMADVRVNGVQIARGEVVVLGDSLNVRVAEVVGVAEDEPVDYG